MRVIAGKYKSRILKEFDNSGTRPTLDRVKEAIFSKLQFSLENAKVLDLFSGTGALGIEAVSRGAERVVFVDSNKTAYELIKTNLKTLKEEQTVLFCDSFLALDKLKKENVKFDVVLLDPPFRKGLGERAIKQILKDDLLSDSGIVMFEFGADEPELEFDGLTKESVKKYGTVKVAYYVKNWWNGRENCEII